jgi:hypothetical protein
MSMPHVAHALRQDSRETYEVYETPERARAQALRSAGEGRLGDALTALTSAWSAERNRALDDDAADIAAIHLANGREDRALGARSRNPRPTQHRAPGASDARRLRLEPTRPDRRGVGDRGSCGQLPRPCPRRLGRVANATRHRGQIR